MSNRRSLTRAQKVIIHEALLMIHRTYQGHIQDTRMSLAMQLTLGVEETARLLDVAGVLDLVREIDDRAEQEVKDAAVADENLEASSWVGPKAILTAKGTLVIDTLGGGFPVIAKGTINGRPFLYRATKHHWVFLVHNTEATGFCYGRGQEDIGDASPAEHERIIEEAADCYHEWVNTESDADATIPPTEEVGVAHGWRKVPQIQLAITVAVCVVLIGIGIAVGSRKSA